MIYLNNFIKVLKKHAGNFSLVTLILVSPKKLSKGFWPTFRQFHYMHTTAVRKGKFLIESLIFV